VPTPFAVNVGVFAVLGVAARFAFAEMTVVFAVNMPVVHVIHMIAVRDRDMPTALAVDVGVLVVLDMCCRHRTLLVSPQLDA
jgi:hypothetical protein